jgi:hypothetical protein
MLKSLQQWNMWRTIKHHRDNKTLLMGVNWYRPEQWDRLREISEDKENFAMTYEESLVESAQKIRQLEEYRKIKRPFPPTARAHPVAYPAPLGTTSRRASAREAAWQAARRSPPAPHAAQSGEGAGRP